MAELRFPSSMLRAGDNTLTLSRSNVGNYNNTGERTVTMVLQK